MWEYVSNSRWVIVALVAFLSSAVPALAQASTSTQHPADATANTARTGAPPPVDGAPPTSDETNTPAGSIAAPPAPIDDALDDRPRSPMDAAAQSGFARYGAALDFAENSFAFGDFDGVIRTLHPWLYPSPVLDAAAQASSDGYAWLGASAWFNDNPELCQKYFEAGLRAHRNMTLDPLVFPPELVQFFREIRDRMQPTREADQAAQSDNTVYIESRVAEHPRWVSMLPFGYGMFVNGENEWGILYALTEVSLLTVSTTLFWANYAQRIPSDDPSRPMGYPDEARAEMRRRVHIGTGAAFIGIVVINMIHGAVIHNRERRVQYRTLSEPPEGFQERSSADRRPQRWQIQVGPIFSTGPTRLHSTW